ncbi:hypothetical protein PV325_007178 [Microctonus aethiopoides]|nr:hypothetical protein PV325_007178 [Microctonus aethiopoides]
MVEETNYNFLEQKVQEDSAKTFESNILKSRRVKRDEANDYIWNKNPYHSPLYEETFRRSLESPEEFWSEVAETVEWSKRWDKVKDNTNEPFTKWYVGGEINACHNAIDRHVNAGNGEKIALIHDSPMTSTIRKVSYNELLDKTSKLAGALANMGVNKGDRVLIYMPLIPETIIAILACARLGAVHSVVFGDYLRSIVTDLFKKHQAELLLASESI